jgi:hypothetical protein
VIPPFVIGLVLIVGIVALAPASRLYRAGVASEVVATWLGAMWLLGIVVFIVPALARFTIPLLIALAVIPFAWPGLIGRLFARRPASRPPMKNVTPPEEPQPRP